MACLPSDDILGSTGVSVLHTLTAPSTLEDVAQKTGLPLFRVRGTVRRLMEAGLVQEAGLRQKVEKMYEITPEGIQQLEEKAEGELREQTLAK